MVWDDGLGRPLVEPGHPDWALPDPFTRPPRWWERLAGLVRVRWGGPWTAGPVRAGRPR